MELLLFLTAMFAGLLSGDRVVEASQMEQAAVAAAAGVDVAGTAIQAAESAVSPAALHRVDEASAPVVARPDISGPPQAKPFDERRLE